MNRAQRKILSRTLFVLDDAPVHTGGGRAVALLIFTAALRASVCSAAVAIEHPGDDVELISELFEDRHDDDAAEQLNSNGFVRGVLSADFDLQSVDPEVRERARTYFVREFSEVRGSDGMVCGHLVNILNVEAGAHEGGPGGPRRLAQWARDLTDALLAAGDVGFVRAIDEGRDYVRSDSTEKAARAVNRYDAMRLHARRMMVKGYSIQDSLRDRIGALLRARGAESRAVRLQMVLQGLEARPSAFAVDVQPTATLPLPEQHTQGQQTQTPMRPPASMPTAPAGVPAAQGWTWTPAERVPASRVGSIPTVVGVVAALALLVWWVRGQVRVPSRRPEPAGATGGAPWEPYAVLGVQPGATREEIARAYREQMKRYHPDRVAHLGAELRELAHRKTLEIQRAYAELGGGTS